MPGSFRIALISTFLWAGLCFAERTINVPAPHYRIDGSYALNASGNSGMLLELELSLVNTSSTPTSISGTVNLQPNSYGSGGGSSPSIAYFIADSATCASSAISNTPITLVTPVSLPFSIATGVVKRIHLGLAALVSSAAQQTVMMVPVIQIVVTGNAGSLIGELTPMYENLPGWASCVPGISNYTGAGASFTLVPLQWNTSPLPILSGHAF